MTRQLLYLGIIFTLLVLMLTPTTKAKASETNDVIVYEDSFELSGQLYQGKVTTDREYDIISIVGPEGTLTATRDISADVFIELVSDYLTPQEEQVQLTALNESEIRLIEGEVGTSDITTDGKTGKWHYGKWKSYSVDFADKTTAAAIAVLILGKIPYIGGLAATVATIAIAHGMSTGHFKAKKDYRILNGSYMEEKSHIKIYKNSDYTGFIRYLKGNRTLWIGH